jgi:hypothetical protein
MRIARRHMATWLHGDARGDGVAERGALKAKQRSQAAPTFLDRSIA